VTTAPDGVGLAAPGAMLDLAAVHLLAESTLRMLSSEHPAGDWDPRRMRPNILVAGDESADEVQWLGCHLRFGAEAVVHIVGRTPRCVMTTLPQPGLRRDPDILRTIAAVEATSTRSSGEFDCAGWYADVIRPGAVRTGDPIRIQYPKWTRRYA